MFTDPPFAGNIPYPEVNFVNEAWLGTCTDSRDEVTFSRAQGKNTSDHELLLTKASREVNRALKMDGKAKVVFHSSSSDVSNNLGRAYTEAGSSVELARILDKTQGSFKQVTTDGAVKGDPVLLLAKRPIKGRKVPQSVLPVIPHLLTRAHASSDGAEQTPQRLYSRFVTHDLTRQQSVPLSADEFYELVVSKSRFENARASVE